MQGPGLSSEFTISTSLPHRAHARVRVSGDIDHAAITCLHAQLTALLDAGIEQVRLDLSAAHCIDHHLLDALGRIRTRLHTRGGSLITIGELLDTPRPATAVQAAAATHQQVARPMC